MKIMYCKWKLNYLQLKKGINVLKLTFNKYNMHIDNISIFRYVTV